MLKLDPSILGSEPPGSGSLGLVALNLQGSNLSYECCFIANAPVQALSAEHTELDLRHIEPATVLGRIVELQTPDDPSGLLGREGLVQGGGSMDVEVIQAPP